MRFLCLVAPSAGGFSSVESELFLSFPSSPHPPSDSPASSVTRIPARLSLIPLRPTNHFPISSSVPWMAATFHVATLMRIVSCRVYSDFLARIACESENGSRVPFPSPPGEDAGLKSLSEAYPPVAEDPGCCSAWELMVRAVNGFSRD